MVKSETNGKLKEDMNNFGKLTISKRRICSFRAQKDFGFGWAWCVMKTN